MRHDLVAVARHALAESVVTVVSQPCEHQIILAKPYQAFTRLATPDHA